MKKVRSLSPGKLGEISALIGESFWDYPYDKGEGGLKELFPTKKAMSDYMKVFVIAGIENGTLYSTDNGEGYIIITDPDSGSFKFSGLIRMIKGMKNALGGWSALFRFLKTADGGGENLEKRMKKEKKRYVKVEMLIVTKQFQGQGYMRKLMEFAYKAADKKNAACILDTDAIGKCERYVHLGMKLVQTREAGEIKIYDLIKEFV